MKLPDPRDFASIVAALRQHGSVLWPAGTDIALAARERPPWATNPVPEGTSARWGRRQRGSVRVEVSQLALELGRERRHGPPVVGERQVQPELEPATQ
jgi:hypothetical protein